MPYNCIVLAKQVPDTKNVTGQAMKDDGTVNRAALPAIFNPEDLNALEMALQIRDQFGGKVTVITMGPPSACEVLRASLYRGADEVIGLARGFIGAGAKSLIVSLWNVHDASAADFMDQFYANLLSSATVRHPTQALRATQLAAIEQGQHPYYWAPFVLVGPN